MCERGAGIPPGSAGAPGPPSSSAWLFPGPQPGQGPASMERGCSWGPGAPRPRPAGVGPRGPAAAAAAIPPCHVATSTRAGRKLRARFSFCPRLEGLLLQETSGRGPRSGIKREWERGWGRAGPEVWKNHLISLCKDNCNYASEGFEVTAHSNHAGDVRGTSEAPGAQHTRRRGKKQVPGRLEPGELETWGLVQKRGDGVPGLGSPAYLVSAPRPEPGGRRGPPTRLLPKSSVSPNPAESPLARMETAGFLGLLRFPPGLVIHTERPRVWEGPLGPRGWLKPSGLQLFPLSALRPGTRSWDPHGVPSIWLPWALEGSEDGSPPLSLAPESGPCLSQHLQMGSPGGLSLSQGP